MDFPSLSKCVSVSRTMSPMVRKVKWVVEVELALEMCLKVDSSSDDDVVVVDVVVDVAAVDDEKHLVSMRI